MPRVAREICPSLGAAVLRGRPAAAREMFAVRLEREFREALDHEAAKRGVSRSDLVRDALVRVVDRDVLEEAAQRERADAILRGMDADAERRAAIRISPDQEPGERPRLLRGCAPQASPGFAQSLADELAGSIAQRDPTRSD